MISYPEAKPTFKEVTTDRVGRLFVQNWDAYGSETVDWLVFRADGHLTANFTVPSDLQLLEIGDDYVITLWKDELDVEFIKIYGLWKEGTT